MPAPGRPSAWPRCTSAPPRGGTTRWRRWTRPSSSNSTSCSGTLSLLPGASGLRCRTSPRLRVPLQLRVDNLGEGVHVAGAHHRDAVDEEGRGDGHAVLLAVVEVILHLVLELAALRAGLELVLVDPGDGAGGLDQLRLGELRLVGEHRVVHLPELPLVLGALGGLGRDVGVRVELQRVVAVNEA